MSWIRSKTQSKYLVSLTALTFAALIAAFSYTARSFGGMLLAIFFIFLSLLPTIGVTNILILLSSITFSLSLAEFSIDIFSKNDKSTYYSPESDYTNGSYWSKSDLGSQARPGRYASKKLTTVGDVVYDVVYSIGEDGFRVTALNNSSARIRINFFGCSLTFGEGLNDKETLPHFLHALDDSISVKNFGFHGYGIHQALRILESTRDTKGNINFLLTAPWHAERSACIPEFSNGSPKYKLSDDGQLKLDGTCGIQLGQGYSLITRTCDLLFHHSKIYKLIRNFTLTESQDRQIDLYLAIIQQINNLSQARNQRFIIGFIKADNAWFTGKYSNEKVVEQMAGMGIEVIDLTLAPSMEQLSRDYYIHPLDHHPSAMANEARAKLLKQYLERGGT